MTASIRISRKAAELFLLEIEHGNGTQFPDVERAAEEIRKALNKPTSSARKKTQARKRTRRAETKSIREAVAARANGFCECGCGRVTRWAVGHLDHFFGRGKTPQSVENCWWLAPECDRAKTENVPNAAHWLQLFIKRCDRHGHFFEAAKARARLEGIVSLREVGP
jgi:hypothetical protein